MNAEELIKDYAIEIDDPDILRELSAHLTILAERLENEQEHEREQEGGAE